MTERHVLLERVATVLAGAGVPHALIGASALAAHGISRSTLDVDGAATLASVAHVLADAAAFAG